MPTKTKRSPEHSSSLAMVYNRYFKSLSDGITTNLLSNVPAKLVIASCFRNIGSKNSPLLNLNPLNLLLLGTKTARIILFKTLDTMDAHYHQHGLLRSLGDLTTGIVKLAFSPLTFIYNQIKNAPETYNQIKGFINDVKEDGFFNTLRNKLNALPQRFNEWLRHAPNSNNLHNKESGVITKIGKGLVSISTAVPEVIGIGLSELGKAIGNGAVKAFRYFVPEKVEKVAADSPVSKPSSSLMMRKGLSETSVTRPNSRSHDSSLKLDAEQPTTPTAKHKSQSTDAPEFNRQSERIEVSNEVALSTKEALSQLKKSGNVEALEVDEESRHQVTL